MNHHANSAWKQPVAADLQVVVQLIEADQSAHLGFVDSLVSNSVNSHGHVPSALLLLTARALAPTAPLAPGAHAFAAAMELIVLSLGAHASLPDKQEASSTQPMLSLGPAIGVLLGDLLYSRAFRLIAGTGLEKGIAEVANITERMVVAATRDRFAPHEITSADQPRTLMAAAYAGCCTLSAALTGASGQQTQLLHDFGLLCATLEQQAGTPAEAGSAAAAAEADALSTQIFPASIYRDALGNLVAQLAARKPADSLAD